MAIVLKTGSEGRKLQGDSEGHIRPNGWRDVREVGDLELTLRPAEVR